MREYILDQLKHYYIPLYGNRFLYPAFVPRNNPSPYPEREAKRIASMKDKLRRDNPYSWPSDHDFSIMLDGELIRAFEHIVRVSTKQM